jgi:NADPH:quinone reductase-like Zn-dependent oxidoreductase
MTGMEREVYISERRGIAGLVKKTETIPPPKPHEVQIAVRAIGLNFADVFCVLGMYEAAPKYPYIPGLEYAGIVEAVGENVTHFKKGDRVMGVTLFGAYATAINVDAGFVRPLPSDWSFEEGAAYLVASLTAYYGLVDQCRLQRSETVLIQSAAGGVGLAALSIAKKYGCYVIGAVGSEEKKEFCLEKGYDAVIVRDELFKMKLKAALAGRELNVVMESIGGKAFTDCYEMLAPRGRIAVYGYAAFMPKNIFSYIGLLWRYLRRPRVDTFNLNNRTVAGFNLIYLFDKADLIRNYADEIDALGIGKPLIGESFKFENLPEAVELLKSGKTTRKMVVTVTS